VEITGIGWMGVRTGDSAGLARFYSEVLGLEGRHTEDDFWVFDLKDGRQIEVFGEGFAGKDHLTTGPVVGFLVDDLKEATEELRRHGVELLGDAGPTWQHFRGPDGNV
jgi:catechol 2,3-dioxygenase-like lactoylglutathione lyase family enzyme